MDVLHTAGRVVLLLLSVYHCVTGVVSVFFVGFAERFYGALYHARPDYDGLLRLVLRPWGALALFAGLVGLFAVADPVRYRGVIAGLAVLLALRVGYRVLLAGELLRVAQIDAVRNWTNITILTVEALVLGLWAATLYRIGEI